MTVQVLIPDIGEANDVEVIEILVSQGETVEADASLVVLESDKASMEIPSPTRGTVARVHVSVGDNVDEGDLLLELDPEPETEAGNEPQPASESEPVPEPAPESEKENENENEQESEPALEIAAEPPSKIRAESSDSGVTAISLKDKGIPQVHAGPAVRKQAREYGVQLLSVKGTGHQGRILKEDIQNYVADRLNNSSDQTLPTIPEVDFSRFGEIELKALPKIRQVSARNLHRSWLNIPHVTQFDEADITDLEEFRKQQSSELAEEGVKLTPLAFLIKASVVALQKFPQFNASIQPDFKHLILKKYFNIGIAVETEEGLVVPVLKEADKKGVIQLAKDSADLASQARNRKLPFDAMQGATFTISSLGGIGGTAFTPIINAPEVAILGVSKARVSPVFNGESFVPRTILPLALSYDHRAIDGAEAVRMLRFLADVLSDMRRVIL
ncbi:MAG: 2-oxo acid dehydrogenase subunit E2 [Gammaproteobacteria bacterium]|nr:2-oxo acid dehydrogenase subunit E2 [Gammaproteobacteria bacterium]